jgi:hypothetical protein
MATLMAAGVAILLWVMTYLVATSEYPDQNSRLDKGRLWVATFLIASPRARYLSPDAPRKGSMFGLGLAATFFTVVTILGAAGALSAPPIPK